MMLLPLQMLFVVWLYRLEKKQDAYLDILDQLREEAEEDVLGVSGRRVFNMCAVYIMYICVVSKSCFML